MKEELLQIKLDITDISNDLKTKLADKGVTADGTLSELVNKVSEIEGNVLGEIGWNLSEQQYLKDAIDYAKEILKNPKNNYLNDKQLVIFPKVETLNLSYSMFKGSGLILFPDGVKLTGKMLEAFYETPITHIDLTGLQNTEYSYDLAFYNCLFLTNITVNENFGKNITSMNSMFHYCKCLTNLKYLNTDSVTTLNSTFNSCENLQSVPIINISNASNISYLFSLCSSLKTIMLVGDVSKLTVTDGTFQGCRSCTYLSIPENFPIFKTNYGIATGIISPKIYGSFDFSNSTVTNGSYYHWLFGFTVNTTTRYVVVKNIGTYEKNTALNMTYSRVWGIANDEVPDAKQSLIDTLITYSFDRAKAGYSPCKITLYSDVNELLTEDEIAQITAKGYTLV